MNNRNFVRYGSHQLPPAFSRVSLAWHSTTLEGSYAVDYSSHGVSIAIPGQYAAELPEEHQPVRVRLPVSQTWLSGRCIHARREADGSATLGVFFPDTADQQSLQRLLFEALNVPHQPGPFVSYEWEELVGKLCDSADPDLKRLGHQHLAQLRARQSDQATL